MLCSYMPLLCHSGQSPEACGIHRDSQLSLKFSISASHMSFQHQVYFVTAYLHNYPFVLSMTPIHSSTHPQRFHHGFHTYYGQYTSNNHLRSIIYLQSFCFNNFLHWAFRQPKSFSVTILALESR